MALRTLTAPGQHGDTSRVTLDRAVYELEWLWNERSSRWWLRLSDDDGQIAYFPIVEGYMLLRSVTGARRPPGELLVLDVLEADREPGLRNFNTDFLLLYVEAAELPEGY